MGDRRIPTNSRKAGRRVGAERQYELLRYSHIFASVVREVLEVKSLREVSPNPLAVSQFHLLKILALNGGYQVGQLAGYLGVSAAAASKTVDKLVRLGLVARSASKGDRRVRVLSPSPKGRRLVQKYERTKAERLAPVLEEFSAKEVDQLADLLERFSVRMIRQEDPAGGQCLRCGVNCEDDCAVGNLPGVCPQEGSRSWPVAVEVAGGVS